MQQKYALSVYGCVVYRHSSTSTPMRPRVAHAYYINLSEMREQTAEASNNMLDHVLKVAEVSQQGCLHLFSDCGPHYRSGLNLAHYVDLCLSRKQELHVSYFAEQHVKSLLDGAFGTLGEWLRQAALKRPVLSMPKLLDVFRQAASDAMKADPGGLEWQFAIVDYMASIKRVSPSTCTAMSCKSRRHTR